MHGWCVSVEQGLRFHLLEWLLGSRHTNNISLDECVLRSRKTIAADVAKKAYRLVKRTFSIQRGRNVS